MRADILRSLLRQLPFLPFQMYLTDGTVFEIRHPELVSVGPYVVQFGLPVSKHPFPITERMVTVALLHITRLEQSPAAVPPSNN